MGIDQQTVPTQKARALGLIRHELMVNRQRFQGMYERLLDIAKDVTAFIRNRELINTRIESQQLVTFLTRQAIPFI